MRTKRLKIMTALLATSLVLTACGGGSDDDSGTT